MSVSCVHQPVRVFEVKRSVSCPLFSTAPRSVVERIVHELITTQRVNLLVVGKTYRYCNISISPEAVILCAKRLGYSVFETEVFVPALMPHERPAFFLQLTTFEPSLAGFGGSACK